MKTRTAITMYAVWVISLALMGFITPTEGAPRVFNGEMCAGFELQRGDRLESFAKLPGTQKPKHHLEFQGDGNLVLYQRPQDTVLFNAVTDGSPADRVAMQADGNLVIYAGNVALKSTQITPQASDPPDIFCNTFLTIDSDGVLRIGRNFPVLWDSTSNLYQQKLNCYGWRTNCR
jgi:hypothetical protein